MQRLSVIGTGIGYALVALLCVGCATDPEKAVTGKWKADDSAAGMAARAAKLKSQMPDAESSVIMAAARSMGNMGLQLREDKTFDLLAGGNTIKGSWMFDKALNEVQLDAKTAEVAPENAEKNPGEFQPKTFVAYYDASLGTLKYYPFDRKTYEMVMEAGNPGKIGFVLYKE